MPRTSSLTLAKSQILAHFAKEGPKIYTEAQLTGLLISEAANWRVVKSTTTEAFIAFLQSNTDFKTYTFHAHTYNRTITRYAWGSVSSHALALSLKSQGYLSHGTAAYLHKLTDLKPKTVYLNVEQSPKPAPRGGLTQAALDQAFARKQRISNYTFRHSSHSVTIIAGKNTNRLGVAPLQISNGESLEVTNRERTLIDITVRPAYAGGVNEVLRAYRAARPYVSVDRLLSILDELAYIYPYHQAIGFLMQVTGYSVGDALIGRPRNYDFHLAHGMQNPIFSKEWRLYYPRNLKILQNDQSF